MIDPGTQATTTIPVGKMPSGLAVGRRCLNRLCGHPLDNTVIAIDTRTGAQTVISAEERTQAVTVDSARHTVVASNTAAGTASVIERR
jgi:hypothetical protein